MTAIVFAAGDHREDGFEVRVVQQRYTPLCDSQVRSPDHSHFPVRPGLRRDPVERVVSIRTLLVQRVECAFRRVAATNILHHNRVTVCDKRSIRGWKIRSFSVRCPNQDGRISRAAGRVKNVGVQMDSIAQGNAHMQQLLHRHGRSREQRRCKQE